MATRAPSTANFSAAARAIPSLDAATMTLRFFNPRSIRHPFLYPVSTITASTFGVSVIAKVGIVFIDPILAWRIKNVQIYCILERHRFMRHMGRNTQDFPGGDSDFPVVD